MTPAGIELATFWFVVQHLNHWATAVPFVYLYIHFITVYSDTSANEDN